MAKPGMALRLILTDQALPGSCPTVLNLPIPSFDYLNRPTGLGYRQICSVTKASKERIMCLWVDKRS